MLKFTALAAAALLLGTSGSLAADAPLYIDESTLDMAGPSQWEGFYAGVGITGAHNVNFAEDFGFLDVIGGFNVQADAFVFGAEAWLSGWRSTLAGPAFSGGVEGRAGYLVTPGALAYLSLGAMNFFVANGNTYAQLGAGMEFALTESMSTDIEYKYWQQLGGSNVTHSLSASVLWHF